MYESVPCTLRQRWNIISDALMVALPLCLEDQQSGLPLFLYLCIKGVTQYLV